ncbi:MAG: aminopeptidase [Clostridiales bacterium]|nr:aminopeptidase [Clostridiales bacterium]
MNTTINSNMLESFHNNFESSKLNKVIQTAVIKSGFDAMIGKQDEQIAHPMLFSLELETGEITNQKGSGRCWMFAGLNTLRVEVMKKLNLSNFEFSQNYPMFWDKLEKANYYLECILDTLDEPTEGRLIRHLIRGPMNDGGQWDMFCALIDKYGCVPKSVMPETFHSSNTGAMNNLITRRLREDAIILRDAYKDGASIDELRAKKDGMLDEVYRLLAMALGEPPKTFTYEYYDKDKVYHRIENLTPHTFMEQYVGRALEDYVSIINAPTADKPYGKTYTVQYLGNIVGGRQVKYLNLPSEDLKKLAIAQMQDGEPVWFGCDVGQMLQRDMGIMGLNTYSYDLLGFNYTMNKAQRLDYATSLMTHAMVFVGVNLVDGKPNRWKVENSWGDTSGQKGYYLMTDEWFDEFNYQIVVNKKYLSEEQLAAWEQEPIVLKPWDPMGSLAL